MSQASKLPYTVQPSMRCCNLDMMLPACTSSSQVFNALTTMSRGFRWSHTYIFGRHEVSSPGLSVLHRHRFGLTYSTRLRPWIERYVPRGGVLREVGTCRCSGAEMLSACHTRCFNLEQAHISRPGTWNCALTLEIDLELL